MRRHKNGRPPWLKCRLCRQREVYVCVALSTGLKHFLAEPNLLDSRHPAPTRLHNSRRMKCKVPWKHFKKPSLGQLRFIQMFHHPVRLPLRLVQNSQFKISGSKCLIHYELKRKQHHQHIQHNWTLLGVNCFAAAHCLYRLTFLRLPLKSGLPLRQPAAALHTLHSQTRA